jgi:predicted RNA-binding protein
MDIGKEFKSIKEFLIRNKGRQFVDELIEVINNSEIDFHPSYSTLTREHLIDIYSTRQEIQKEINKDEFVKGYEEVLSNLNKAQTDQFAITSINSDNGAYIIFVDQNRNDLIGILKSHRTLTEIRTKYADHEALVGQQGLKYKRTENIFIRGEQRI